MNAHIAVINQQRLLAAQELTTLARLSLAVKDMKSAVDSARKVNQAEEYIRSARREMELVKDSIEINKSLFVEIEMMRMSMDYLNKQIADVDAACIVAKSVQRIMSKVV